MIHKYEYNNNALLFTKLNCTLCTSRPPSVIISTSIYFEHIKIETFKRLCTNFNKNSSFFYNSKYNVILKFFQIDAGSKTFWKSNEKFVHKCLCSTTFCVNLGIKLFYNIFEKHFDQESE